MADRVVCPISSSAFTATTLAASISLDFPAHRATVALTSASVAFVATVSNNRINVWEEGDDYCSTETIPVSTSIHNIRIQAVAALERKRELC